MSTKHERVSFSLTHQDQIQDRRTFVLMMAGSLEIQWIFVNFRRLFVHTFYIAMM